MFVYVHVEPGGSFVASGVYKPLVAYLRPVRTRIVERLEAFEAVLAEVAGSGAELSPVGHTLTGMPRGSLRTAATSRSGSGSGGRAW